jgi:hypothetical protein
MKLKPVPSGRRAARDLPPSDDAKESPQLSDVRGQIDNATADRLYGWAWDANHPGARLKVELRLAGEVVANTIADFVRPDLARTGVGDGCHAFEFPLVPSWIERRAELTAIAFGVDGSEFPIAMRLRRPEDAAAPGAAAAQIVRALETMQGEQDGLRAELKTLRERTEILPDAATMEAIREAQDSLERKVEQLELWLTRLDDRLGQAMPDATPSSIRRLDVWQAALIAVLASAASAALAFVLANNLLMR